MAAKLSEKRAAGFIIFRRVFREIEYLLLQTSYKEHHWTPPKGHVDPGESDYETALRETEEEAGFEKEDLRVVPDFTKVLHYSVKGVPKIVTYWLAELCSDKSVTLSHEHQDYKWAPLEKSCELARYSDMQDVLRECQEFLDQENKIS